MEMLDYDYHSQDVKDVHVASDHAGFELKKEIILHLEKQGYNVTDHGAYELDETDDYPDYVKPAAEAVSADYTSRAIILGGSGQGEAILANRFPNVRAVVFNGQYAPGDREIPEEVITARQHNDANILSLGARFLNTEEALEAVDQFMETDFSGDERHIRRLAKIESVL